MHILVWERQASRTRGPSNKTSMKLQLCLLVQVLAISHALPQLSFDFGSALKNIGKAVEGVLKQQQQDQTPKTRLGLLASDLGLSPTAETGGSNNQQQQSAPFTDSGSAPQQNQPQIQESNNDASGGDSLSGRQQQQCCCEPLGSTCDPFGSDLVGGGLIDARGKNRAKPQINTRIVNRYRFLYTINPIISYNYT